MPLAGGRAAAGGCGMRMGHASERERLAWMGEKTGEEFGQGKQTHLQHRCIYEVSTRRIWMADRCTGSTASAGMSA